MQVRARASACVRLGISMAQLHILLHAPAQRRDADEPAGRGAQRLAVERHRPHRPDGGARVRRARPASRRTGASSSSASPTPAPDARRGRRAQRRSCCARSSAASTGSSSPASAGPSPSCVARSRTTTGVPSDRHPASTPAPRSSLDHPRCARRPRRCPHRPPHGGGISEWTDLSPPKPTPSHRWRRTPPSA